MTPSKRHRPHEPRPARMDAAAFLAAVPGIRRVLAKAKRPLAAPTDPWAAFTWLAYRVGVLADPIAHAWGLRATALGWPEGGLEPGDGSGGLRQEPGGRQC